MIEINLLEVKKPFKLPQVLGVDLNLIPFKALALAIFISYLPDILFTSTWEEEKQQLDTKIRAKDKQLKKINASTKGQGDFKDQIEAFVKQEKKLEEKLKVVRQIIEQKKNPMSIMLYLTKNIPSDVWLLELAIKGSQISIKGESQSYKSIGVFIENLRRSVFFDSSLYLKDSKTQENADKVRTEYFEIQGKIKRFD